MWSQVLDISLEEVKSVFPCGAYTPQQDPSLDYSSPIGACIRFKVQLQILQKKYELFCFSIICSREDLPSNLAGPDN